MHRACLLTALGLVAAGPPPRTKLFSTALIEVGPLKRVEDASGHCGGTRDQAEAEEADFYPFLLWQAGVPGFRPPP
jgi:hypothetical protein